MNVTTALITHIYKGEDINNLCIAEASFFTDFSCKTIPSVSVKLLEGKQLKKMRKKKNEEGWALSLFLYDLYIPYRPTYLDM